MRSRNDYLQPLLCVALIVVITVCQGCSSNSVGTGRSVDETRPLSPFSNVVVSGPMTVFLHSSPIYKVVVTTDDNVVDHVTTIVTNDSLVIDVDIQAPLFSTMVVHVYAPGIRSITSNGTGSLSAPDSLVGDLVSIVNNSTKDFWIHRVSATHMQAVVSSAGDVFFDNSYTHSLMLNMNGSGSLHAFTLKSDTTTVNISGSGNAELFVNHLLRGVHSGSGQIKYLGNPEVEIEVTGAGGVGGR
jgi:hypothetical protein